MFKKLLKTPEDKKNFLYGLILLLVFALVGYLVLSNTKLDAISVYLYVLLFFLCLGIAHAWLFQDFLPWLINGKDTIFNIILTIAGAVVIAIMAYFMKSSSIGYGYAFCMIMFPVGFAITKAFEKYLAIPDRFFKLWYYPINAPMPDLDLIDLSKILVVQFEFSKYYNDPHFTNFKAKAPVEMPFGELFMIFMNDYNDRNTDSPIQYTNQESKPYGWVFFKKEPWYKPNRYMDADLNFRQNNIVDNDIIYARRVGV